jgi:hypothetical protein
MPLFKKQLLAKVLDGSKVQTRRTHKSEWTIGEKYGVRTGWLAKAEGYIVITRKWRERLGDISQEDVRKEGFSTNAEFKEEWTKINGSWDPDRIVIAYEFRLVEK